MCSFKATEDKDEHCDMCAWRALIDGTLESVNHGPVKCVRPGECSRSTTPLNTPLDVSLNINNEIFDRANEGPMAPENDPRLNLHLRQMGNENEDESALLGETTEGLPDALAGDPQFALDQYLSNLHEPATHNYQPSSQDEEFEDQLDSNQHNQLDHFHIDQQHCDALSSSPMSAPQGTHVHPELHEPSTFSAQSKAWQYESIQAHPQLIEPPPEQSRSLYRFEHELLPDTEPAMAGTKSLDDRKPYSLA